MVRAGGPTTAGGAGMAKPGMAGHDEDKAFMTTAGRPFEAFARSVQPQTPLRAAITAATRRAEPECVVRLLSDAAMPDALAGRTQALARTLVTTLRAKGTRGAVEGLVREYDLSSQEGVALMCLAEALLRIPDRATRDALIRDKIAAGIGGASRPLARPCSSTPRPGAWSSPAS